MFGCGVLAIFCVVAVVRLYNLCRMRIDNTNIIYLVEGAYSKDGSLQCGDEFEGAAREEQCDVCRQRCQDSRVPTGTESMPALSSLGHISCKRSDTQSVSDL